MEMWRKYRPMYGLLNIDIAIVAATASACRISSNFSKRCDFILYNASDSYQYSLHAAFY